MPQITENYIAAGQVLYIFVNLPLSFHPQAQTAAEAAECANQQQDFWPMHDMLFNDQEAWSGNADAQSIFQGYAAELGLDEAAFQTCMSEHQALSRVQSDLGLAQAVGAQATPTFFINGQKLEGAYPYEQFQQIIDSILAQLP